MGKRLFLTVWATVLAAALAGCGGVSSPAPSTGEQKPSGTQAAEPASEPKGPTIIQPSTERERAALALAATEQGRKWAMGNPDGSMGSAKGDPSIIGYQVQFVSGGTMHSVVVLGGAVSRFFGAPGGEFTPREAVVTGTSGTSSVNYADAEGDAQKAAVAAARKYLETNGFSVSAGGIEGIVIAYPRVDDGGRFDGQDPGVTVFAKSALGDFASGGPSVRY